MTMLYYSPTKQAETMTSAFRIVISETGNNFTPFATHCETIDETDKPAGKYWGHYCETFKEAIDDFIERCSLYDIQPVLHRV